jgi:bacillithiol biosynthesis deacetylase BshB1
MKLKLDVLGFGAHPDDVEISCGGSIAKLVQSGKSVGLIDLTMGELGTRGSGPLRLIEASAAAEVLGVKYRENLQLDDGFFEENQESLLKVIEMIRKYRPEVVLANSIKDRHPDHARGASLVSRACFLSGLRKIETSNEGKVQEVWRPKSVYHYIQDYYIDPDFVIDVSDFFEIKMASIKAYKSQFFDPNSPEPETPISGSEFFDVLKSRAMDFGRPAGAVLGEGFTVERPPLVEDFFDLA